jgi:hypothetical protein
VEIAEEATGTAEEHGTSAKKIFLASFKQTGL